MKGVRVAESDTGHGVFATRQFRADETIGWVAGTIVDDPKYGSQYCIGIDDHRALEPAAPFRYLNHSCQPNCALVMNPPEEDDPAAGDIRVDTLREIIAGEQLTIDYAWPAEVAVPCSCGSPNCRGWIVDAEQVGRVFQWNRDWTERSQEERP
jgi:hypothetical protein